MGVLRSLLAIAVLVGSAACVGDKRREASAPTDAPSMTFRLTDAPPAAPTTPRPAVGGGPRDPEPECSVDFPHRDRSSLPPNLPDAPLLDPCAPKPLPPIDAPTPLKTK